MGLRLIRPPTLLPDRGVALIEPCFIHTALLPLRLRAALLRRLVVYLWLFDRSPWRDTDVFEASTFVGRVLINSDRLDIELAHS